MADWRPPSVDPLTWSDRSRRQRSDASWSTVHVAERHRRYEPFKFDAKPAFHRPGLFDSECSVRGVDGGLPSRTVLDWRPGWAGSS